VQDADRAKQQVIFPDALLDEFLARVGAKTGDAVLFTSGPWEATCKALGVLRTQLGQPLLRGESFCGLEPVDPSRHWAFLWVREFTMFEWDPEAKRWAPRHHMFTMPNPEHLERLETAPGEVYAQLYDLVLSGNELGSGSIRIHRPDIQERVMKVVGFSPAELQAKFGFLIAAYRFASPPHGGIGSASTASSC
jgi:aspartyl-tRNA synthetase